MPCEVNNGVQVVRDWYLALARFDLYKFNLKKKTFDGLPPIFNIMIIMNKILRKY